MAATIHRKPFSFKLLWEVIKKSFVCFGDDKVPKLSASLAYYTVFSMGPLLIVLIFMAGFFFGREAIEGSIYGQLRGVVGSDTAAQIQSIVKNAALSKTSTVAATIGVITLLIGATTVFAEIQDSINTIWGIKPKPTRKGWKVLLMSRLLSFGAIVSLGFLLLVSLAISGLIEILNDRLLSRFPDASLIVMYVLNLLITLTVITTIFGVVFRVLPDAHIRWKDVLPGSITTALLFMLGKFGISYYIGTSNVGTTYGTAGSFVILLLWVYYSAIILYFGAEFTKNYALVFGSDIRPTKYAVVARSIEIEGGRESLREHEKVIEEAKSKGFVQLHQPVEPPKMVMPEPEGLGSKEVLRSLGVLAISRLLGWTKSDRANN